MKEIKNENKVDKEKENKQAMNIGGQMVKKMIEIYLKAQEGN